MISLTAMEQTHTGTASDGAPSLVAVCDELLNRVLDTAEFYCWKAECNGANTALFVLKKPVGGKPAGSVLPLRALHALLVPTKR